MFRCSSAACIGSTSMMPNIFQSTSFYFTHYIAKYGHNCTVDVAPHINVTHMAGRVPVIAIAIACTESSKIFLINSKNIIRKDIVSYLQLQGPCSIDLHDIARFSNATDLKVLNMIRGSKLIINTNSTQYKHDENSMRYLGTVAFESGIKSGIPNMFLDTRWPLMAEATFVDYGITTFPTRLKHSMPHLQDLNLGFNKLQEPPDFPWDNEPLKLPRNLTRKLVFNQQYEQRTIVKPNLYRRFLLLEFNNIQNLSLHQFKGVLQKLSLKGNGLHSLGVDCFVNLVGTNILDLSRNQLTQLPRGVFLALNDLLELHLEWNNITTIAKDTFQNCKKLKLLYLNNNRISVIPKQMLGNHEELVEIHLDNNALVQVFPGALPNNSNKLKKLFLQNNQLTSLPDTVFCGQSLLKVFMANNRITFKGIVDTLDSIPMVTVNYCLGESSSSLIYELRKTSTYVDLTNNNITTIDISRLSKEQRLKLKMALIVFEIDLKNNALRCDCRMLYIKQLLTNITGSYPNTKNRFNSWLCSTPSELKGKRLLAVSDRSLLCTYTEPDCPAGFSCFVRGIDDSFVIHGRNKRLKELPLTMPSGKQLEIYLDNNEIDELDMRSYLSNVTVLDLSSNKIKHINDSFIAQLTRLKKFRLDSNELQRLPRSIQNLTSRKYFVSLSIYHNYLLCDCHAKWLKPWIKNMSNKLKYIKDIKCASGKVQGKPIYKVPLEDFTCEQTDREPKGKDNWKREEYVIGLIILAVILVIIIIVFTLVYYFRGEMKVLMYTHFNWHPFDQVEDQDSTKNYDVFISYSNQDTSWVNEQLKNKLESHDPPYRVCIHERDFEVGATIFDNILNSVDQSKRMIIVLSNSFIQSEWCRFEFRAAHQKVLEDKTNYLILVLFDDVNSNSLDDEIKLYLRTNTYLSVSNKWFWQKLLYALPKPRTQGTETIVGIEMN